MGYETAGTALLILALLIPAVPPALAVLRLARGGRAALRSRAGRRLSILAGGCVLLYALAAVDAWVVEPAWPRVRTIELRGSVSAPLEILHLSDLHIEAKPVRREAWLAGRLADLAPDLVLLTGDIHQAGNRDPETLRAVFRGMKKPPLGIYACLGYDSKALLRAALPGVEILENRGVVIRRGADTIGVAGLAAGPREGTYAAIEKADLRIAIHHFPDLAEEAAGRGVSLYLCGHTHGGQVRLPFWGAIITNCESGKTYEAGLYRVGETSVFTSRGFGLEPKPAPQVRFLCRPEIARIRILPAGR